VNRRAALASTSTAARSVTITLASATLTLTACVGGQAASPAEPPPVVPPPTAIAQPVAPPRPPADPLGPRPEIAPPAPFTPPVPEVYTRPNGMKVWLLERHSLPLVSMEIVVRAGAADDPRGQGGLAYMTANMLDEGAGKRGALDIARDVDRLGATLHTGAYADYSFVQLTSLKKNFAAATTIAGDVVGAPAFAPVEWKRVHDLWANDLKQRQSEPSAVANVVMLRKLFGAAEDYAHPTDGTTKSAPAVTLERVKKFYGAMWRPDNATCVVVGDVTRAELDPILDKALAAWKAAPAKASQEGGVASGLVGSVAQRRVVVVDRPDAPQSVIAVARSGVKASSEQAPALVRVNAALGGSFTSRLNQDLREEHGWSYGAKSRFSFTARPGYFVAQAAVHTEHTGEALAAMLRDIESYAKAGPTDAEADKTRLLARADLVEAFEGVESAAHRLSRNAGVGLPADHEATASRTLYAANKDELKTLAAHYLDLADSVIVIVGPRAKLTPQLEKIGISNVETSGPEGD
jgi:zinc protease